MSDSAEIIIPFCDGCEWEAWATESSYTIVIYCYHLIEVDTSSGGGGGGGDSTSGGGGGGGGEYDTGAIVDDFFFGPVEEFGDTIPNCAGSYSERDLNTRIWCSSSARALTSTQIAKLDTVITRLKQNKSVDSLMCRKLGATFDSVLHIRSPSRIMVFDDSLFNRVLSEDTTFAARYRGPYLSVTGNSNSGSNTWLNMNSKVFVPDSFTTKPYSYTRRAEVPNSVLSGYGVAAGDKFKLTLGYVVAHETDHQVGNFSTSTSDPWHIDGDGWLTPYSLKCSQ